MKPTKIKLLVHRKNQMQLLYFFFLRYFSSSHAYSQRKQNASLLSRRRSSVFQDRRGSVFGLETIKQNIDQGLPQICPEHVEWAVIVTGRGGGAMWPGFTAVVEVCGKNQHVSRGTLHDKRKDFPLNLDISGGIVCACHWDGSVEDIKAADAVFFETSQDM